MNDKKKLLHLLGFILAIAAVYIVIDITGLRRSLLFFHNWIDSFGYWAPAVFFIIYVIATVFIVPFSLLSIAAGLILGSLIGTIVSSIGSALGGGLCFLISRYMARDYVKCIIEKNGRFQRLDLMTEKYGAYIVAVSRIVPIFPGALLNYGFGLTKVRFSTFLFWTWLGMIPEIMAYVVGSNVVYRMIINHRINWHKVGLLVVVIACIAGITIRTQRYLSRPNTVKGED